MIIITDPIRVFRVGSPATTMRPAIEVMIDIVVPGAALAQFNDLFLAIVDAKGLLVMGLGIVLVEVVSNNPEVRVVHKAHEEGGNDTSKKGRGAVDPHVLLIDLAFNSKGVQIANLIG